MNWLSRLLMWIGGIFVIFFVLALVVLVSATSRKGMVAANTVLELDLETGLWEDKPASPLAKLHGGDMPDIRSIVFALERAANDDRVKGLLARMGAAPISLAQAQELRDAIAGFRAKKKFAVAFAETFGEFSAANSAYYLATAFDEIWVQPSGDVGLNGVLMKGMFIRGTLDKLGVVPRMDQRYEYKNAMNMYTEREFTRAHEEAMAKVKDSWYGQIVRGIAEGRKLTESEIQAIIDRGPLLGPEALRERLVDGLAYRDEVFDKTRKRAGNDGKLLFLHKYADRVDGPYSKGKKVALIHGAGAVQRGSSGYDPLMDEQTMGSETVAGAFRAAIEDRDVKAILFRVDSPGGSYVASDTIWREVVRARRAGKPVVVSMSTLAGSGGYFVAMAADKIIAQPGTITGSIGVLGGKMLMKGLYDKLGLTFDSVQSGQHAAMFDDYTDYSPTGWQRFQATLDRIYSDFTSKVAEGRKLPKEKVLEIAKGRIWTGEDAKNLGLVDELGGYPAAIRQIRQLAKFADTEPVQLVAFPKKKSLFETLLAMMQGEERESSESAGEVALARTLRILQPALRTLRAMGVTGEQPGVLTMQQQVPAR